MGALPYVVLYCSGDTVHRVIYGGFTKNLKSLAIFNNKAKFPLCVVIVFN